MNKILQLIIDDYQNHPTSAEYKLALHRYCEVERKFMSSLSEKQVKEYLELDFIGGELNVVEQNEFAQFIFDYVVSEIFKC